MAAKKNQSLLGRRIITVHHAIPLTMGKRRRKPNSESASNANFAFYRDRTSHHLRIMATDSQPQTGTAIPGILPGLCALKCVKYLFQIAWSYTDTVV